MNSRSVALCLLAACATLGAGGIAFVLWDDRGAVRVPAPELAEEPPGIADVRRQIADESKAGVREATVYAAPTPAVPRASAEPLAAAAPTPPEGYSFTSAPTELTVVAGQPTSERSAAFEPTPDNPDQLAWLFADPNAIGDMPLPAIARQARQMQRDWAFGWLRLADGTNAQEVRTAVAPFGVDILAASGRLLRAKLPADEASLAAAAALPGVSGLGVMPPERKTHEAFRAEVHAAPRRQQPVLITLMAHDQNGRWRHALEALGVEVGRFDADIRAYAANIDAAALDAALEADFVLAIEPMELVRAAHDTAVPAMGADAVRFHADGAGLFTGTAGRSVPIGVMDTGLNTNHLDIASHRQSICGANFVWRDHRTEDADLWVDEDGHGTHVTGTIAGNGFLEPKYAGMAPAVAHIRFAKVLDRGGSGPFDGIYRGMDFLSRASVCGAQAVAAKPLVVNMSLAATNRRWLGRSSSERKLDAVVWAHRQLYVVAQSNFDIGGFSNFGAAKSSLSVGAIRDDGELATFSSWGPTFDGRLAPQVVATGVDVYSARGGGRRGGYQPFSGTSMASPATAGVAALLMDAVADYREQPALARARLMASAIKPDAWLETGDAFAATNSAGPGVIQAQYGLGKASARTSALQREEADGWENGAGTSTLMHGDRGYQDIEVPEGASRLDLVLAWDEPPADTIGSTVLNDIDLWLHRDADCEDAECGEYSVSRRDNVEWVIVKNPTPGTYRASVVARRVYGAPPRAGLAWTVVRGPSTPTLRLAVDEVRSIGEREHRVVLSLSVDGYVAAGVQVSVTGCRAAAGKECDGNVAVNDIRPVTGEDGIMYSPPYANRALVGEVSVGERQQVAFDVKQYENRSSPPEYDSTRLYFTASAWNATSAVASAALPGTDGEQPPAEAAPPANDDFADATVLNGASGTIEADLLAATVEPGEPPRLRGDRGGERLAASVWFRWTAPARGATRFGVQALTYVDIFRGQHIAALAPLAFGSWGVSFFAEEGETYRIRVSRSSNYYGDPAQLMLSWSQGPRPANDDFVDAVELADAEGEVAGDNRGATLEPGELLGDLAATVWYRWTAPEDGAWRFRADHWQSVVLVFTGNSLATLRLVSDFPSGTAEFPAGAGVEYRIAVVARGAFDVSRSFNLKWEKHVRGSDSDDFAHAIELTGESGAVSVGVGATVEPDEPTQTGVRSGWWRWTAPASGRFTWRLTDTTNTEFKVAVFTWIGTTDETAEGEDSAGPSLAALQFVASTGPRVTATEFSFEAVGNQRYWISVGLHTREDAAFGNTAGGATLEWGETPANDSLAGAIALAGSSGSTTASNGFATLGPDEPSGLLGHSSLWWSFTPAEGGWYRFWVEDAYNATLAVYRVRGEGFEGLERVARSHGDWQPSHAADAASAVFQATAEQRYLIRVGQRGDGTSAEWTLNWDQAGAPTWLRYAGRLRAATLGLTPDSAPNGASLAFEDGGNVLYLGTSEGLHVLARDAGSGAMEQVRTVEMDEPRALLWDRGRSRLYALVDCVWRQLAPSGDARSSVVDRGALAIGGDGSPSCDARAAFLDSTGAFLYQGHAGGIDIYAIGNRRLRTVETVAIDNFKHAVDGGTGVYATDGNSLRVFARDEETGRLAAAGEVGLGISAVAIATSEDDGYVVALAPDGTAEAYARPFGSDVPQHLNTMGPVGNPTWRDAHGECGFVAARNGPAAMDAFCRNSAFSAAIRVADESASLEATDYVANWQADRFNNYIPPFKSQALAASPDGRHAYVYSEGDILIFERVGNPPPTASSGQPAASATRLGR